MRNSQLAVLCGVVLAAALIVVGVATPCWSTGLQPARPPSARRRAQRSGPTAGQDR